MPAQLPGVVCQVLNSFEIDAGTLCRNASPTPGVVNGTAPQPTKDTIVAACEARWDAYKNDCSGFLKAVAHDLGISITGLANDIVDAMQNAPWTMVASGKDAKAKADAGYLVIGGLKEDEHGHVVVVVSGPLNRGAYPTAYWGRLGSVGKKATTINWAWNKTDRDRVSYAYYSGPVSG